jgi:hypothetical protein
LLGPDGPGLPWAHVLNLDRPPINQWAAKGVEGPVGPVPCHPSSRWLDRPLTQPANQTEATLTPARIQPRTFRLEPDDPQALNLARLFNALVANHGREYAAYETLASKVVELRSLDQQADLNDVNTSGLQAALETREAERRASYQALLDAILDASGQPQFSPSDWFRPGLALLDVVVANRHYLVGVAADEGRNDFVDSHETSLVVTVVEL